MTLMRALLALYVIGQLVGLLVLGPSVARFLDGFQLSVCVP